MPFVFAFLLFVCVLPFLFLVMMLVFLDLLVPVMGSRSLLITAFWNKEKHCILDLKCVLILILRMVITEILS